MLSHSFYYHSFIHTYLYSVLSHTHSPPASLPNHLVVQTMIVNCHIPLISSVIFTIYLHQSRYQFKWNNWQNSPNSPNFRNAFNWFGMKNETTMNEMSHLPVVNFEFPALGTIRDLFCCCNFFGAGALHNMNFTELIGQCLSHIRD